jgi:hypothetical protein
MLHFSKGGAKANGTVLKMVPCSWGQYYDHDNFLRKFFPQFSAKNADFIEHLIINKILIQNSSISILHLDGLCDDLQNFLRLRIVQIVP